MKNDAGLTSSWRLFCRSFSPVDQHLPRGCCDVADFSSEDGALNPPRFIPSMPLEMAQGCEFLSPRRGRQLFGRHRTRQLLLVGVRSTSAFAEGKGISEDAIVTYLLLAFTWLGEPLQTLQKRKGEGGVDVDSCFAKLERLHWCTTKRTQSWRRQDCPKATAACRHQGARAFCH